jgi:hypothetical protein
MSLIWSVVPWAGAVGVAGLVGGLWSALTVSSAWGDAVRAMVVALVVAAPVTWLLSRVLARRRLLAALDVYARREIAHSRRRRWQRRPAAFAADSLQGTEPSA